MAKGLKRKKKKEKKKCIRLCEARLTRSSRELHWGIKRCDYFGRVRLLLTPLNKHLLYDPAISL
jgi:hypothetical protein